MHIENKIQEDIREFDRKEKCKDMGRTDACRSFHLQKIYDE